MIMKFHKQLTVSACLLGMSILLFGCQQGAGDDLPVAGGPVKEGRLMPVDSYARKEVIAVHEAAERVAKTKNVEVWELTPEDVQTDPKIKELGLGDPDKKSIVETDLGMDPEFMSVGSPMIGFKKLDFNDPKLPALNYAVPPLPNEVTNDPKTRTFRSLGETFKGKDIVVYELKVTTPPPTVPDEKGKPKPSQDAPMIREVVFGPIEKSEADKQIEQVKKQGVKIEHLKTIPALFYVNEKGRVVVAVEGPVKAPHRMTMPQLIYYPASPAKMNEMAQLGQQDPKRKMPPQRIIPVAILEKG